MPKQSNGTYQQPNATAAVPAATIDPTAFNTLITDIGSELTNAIDKQGRTAMTAALPLFGNATLPLHAVPLQQVQAYATPSGIATSLGYTPANKAGDIFTGEVKNTNANAFRAVQGNFGAFLRNDGVSSFLMQTASGDQYGAFNAFRPFQWNLTTGAVTIDATGVGASFGGAVTGATATLGDNTTKFATTAFVLANTSATTNVRQTVLSGPQTAGVPSFLPATSASLSLVSQSVAVGAPLIVSVANGFGTSGNVDIIGQSTANLTWTAVTAVTNYHGVTIAAGALTAFTTTLLPIYQYGGTIAITTGQYTFDVAQMKMFLGSGTVANQVNAVFVGESVAAATTITSTVAYQYIGYFDSGFINTLPGAGTFTSKNSNLGLADQNIQLVLKNLTTEGGYAVGDQVVGGINGAVSASYPQSTPITATRLTSGFSTGSYAAIQLMNKSIGGNFNLTAANWAYRVIARRSWGGA